MRLNNYLNEGINDKGIFKAVFMAGTPGAGKSYVANKISSGSISPRIINSDTWTEFLKAYGSEKWVYFHEKIKLLTQNQLALYLDGALPLWVDGTSSSPPATLRREGILKSLGYDTAMVWVETDLETAKRRAKSREKEMGRPVDVEFIEETYEKIHKLKSYYKSNFKVFLEVHNNDGELTDKAINDAYKKATSFFSSPVQNPIGSGKIERMHEHGYKYLHQLKEHDTAEIKKLTNGWFR